MRSTQTTPAPPRAALDSTDVALIGELVADGRASYTRLAERVGLSPAAARTRVQRLVDDRVVTVSARVDARTTGTAIIELALISVAGPAGAVAARLMERDELVFVVCATGPWALFAEIWCRDEEHLLETYAALRDTPGVQDIEVLPVVEHFKQDWSGLAEELTAQRTPAHERRPRRPEQPLDGLDEGIVAELMANGRVSFAEMATRVGLSPAAVRSRAQRLLDERTVVVQTMVSQAVLGRGTFAGVLLTVRGDARRLAERLVELNESTLVLLTRGRYQVACELWSRDSLHLLDTLDRIRALDDVHRAECYPYLEIAKEIYRVGEHAPR